jgi:hypothetical protein
MNTAVRAPSDPPAVMQNVASMATTRAGRLTALRTKAEVQASNDTVEVYIVEIPSRSANALLEYAHSSVIDSVDSDKIQASERGAPSTGPNSAPAPPPIRKGGVSSSTPKEHRNFCGTTLSRCIDFTSFDMPQANHHPPRAGIRLQ